MTLPDWNDRYATKDTPWDTGEPDPHLVELVASGVLSPCRLLEVGCGTGTNALWLASRGFDVVAIDVSALAIERAQTKLGTAAAPVRFATLDFFSADVPGGPFDVVFDRGVLHIFDDAETRDRFAARVASSLASGGQWISLAGSTEGPARDHGPPRRSARELLAAIEPVLELVELRATTFHAHLPSPAQAWLVRSRVRAVPAQPSSRRDVP